MPIASDADAPGAEASPARVLIVEDRALVAAKVERSVRAAGYAVAGVTASLSATLAYVRQAGARLDAAVLDIDLRGEPVYPAAERLRECGVPFLFLTGYGRPAIDPLWAGVARIEKPFEGAELARMLGALLAGSLDPASEDHAPALTLPVRRAWENLRQSRDIVTEARAWQEAYGLASPPKRS